MTVSETPQPQPQPPYFTITPLPGKGMSAITTTRIPSDTLLFTERPLLLLSGPSQSIPLHTRVLTAFHQLHPKSQAAFLSLCSNLSPGEKHTDETIALAVWKANNFCLNSEGSINGVFELAARLNHACVGGDNCRWEWDRETREMRFWTTRDVEKGEELTHCYRPDWRMGTRNRREALWEEYGFWCGCTTCQSPEED
ncbi:hypothetical protein BZA77DRAFT_319521 [Pyronema omphalodes]|nr:hypothetical protein BZA77DRAFT_319521 [Pyronema omphalodes]